jgi:hypothetical protein
VFSALSRADLLKHDGEERRPELLCSFLLQVLPSLLLAGCGMVAAGLLLDVVQVQ